jgi:hypothetical protein
MIRLIARHGKTRARSEAICAVTARHKNLAPFTLIALTKLLNTMAPI